MLRRSAPLARSLPLVALVALAGVTGCRHPAEPSTDAGAPAPSVAASALAALGLDAAASLDAAAGADGGALFEEDAGLDASVGDAGPLDEPMALHLESKEALLALFSIVKPAKRGKYPERFLDKTFGVGTPGRVHQGNKERARHAISKAACLAGLRDVTLQTEEQRALCGAENMVPVWKKGKEHGKPQFCVDIFEFPNKACELPMVWTSPVQAKEICELQGKRLCVQEEWMMACRADPDGGKDQAFAYGDELDISACNTNKPARRFGPGCDPTTAMSTYRTCATNTEPSGSFPRCRSRYGVYDQHGNVAEIMVRRESSGAVVSQLKGSAFFYVDVARTPENAKRPARDTYPDHCNHDPRWHVEPMSKAWHVNYHLGFRCCKAIR